MSEEYNYIAVTHHNYQGCIAVIKETSESGIILNERNENNTGWKVQFSFDDKSLVKRFNPDELNIHNKINDNLLLERLIRDINSDDLNTRQWSSEVLCYFIEEVGSELDFNLLKSSVDEMKNSLSVEEDFDVQLKLSEGIFEFIYLQKLDKSSEYNLITKLAALNKDVLYTYLDDEEYLQFDEVKDFIEDKSKWWNTSS